MDNTDVTHLTSVISGDVKNDDATLEKYSHDTSLFEIKPQVVVYPKDTKDVEAIVDWVNSHKSEDKSLSITARSGGTDMSGGSINDSIIVVFEKYMNHLDDVAGNMITSQPGVWYRDFEKVTLEKNKIMPAYPASKDICAIGGMVANDAGGEKSLVYGKVEKFVTSLRAVLHDGKEYSFRALNEQELKEKLSQDDFEGSIYRAMHKLLDQNYELIQDAKPNVTKNSTGHTLWDIWDKEAGTFDLSQLLVGSQGTLGLITETTFRLVNAKKHSGVLAGYARSTDNLGEIIEILRKHNPTAIEGFDEHTLRFAFRFFLKFRHSLGWLGLFKLAISLIPDAFILLRGKPILIFMASFDDDDPDVIKQKVENLKQEIDAKGWKITTERADTESRAERFWIMRRESFNLLRKNIKGNLHTAPFIDDILVPPEHLPDFLPKIKAIMKKYKFVYTIAGHLGDGNFHIIPLMDLSLESEREKIEPCLREVIELVKSYDGVISGEHNDGMIRGPFLEKMYGQEVYKLFEQTKYIFDPNNIFNPHKKTDANWEYSKNHIRRKF